MAHPQDNTPKLPKARLNASRNRVCCPHRRSYYSAKDRAWHEDWCNGWILYIAPREYAGGAPVLVRREGWVQDEEDGYVHEHNYSRKQREHGRRPKDRRLPPYVHDPAAVPKGAKVLSHRVITLPAWATCPECDRPMEIDPDVLELGAPPPQDLDFAALLEGCDFAADAT